MKPTDIIDIPKLRNRDVHSRQNLKEEQDIDTVALDLSNFAVEAQQEEEARPINPLALQARIPRCRF